MIRKQFNTALIIGITILFSIKFSYLYSVLGIKPDLILILLIRRSLSDPRPLVSLAWGFGAGLAVDLAVGDVLGVSSLSYSLISFFVSYYKRNSVYMPSYKRTLLYVYSIGFSSLLIYTVTASEMPFIKNLTLVILPSAVYTMAAAVVFQTLKPTR